MAGRPSLFSRSNRFRFSHSGDGETEPREVRAELWDLRGVHVVEPEERDRVHGPLDLVLVRLKPGDGEGRIRGRGRQWGGVKSGSGMRGQLAVLGTMSRAPSTPTPRAFGGPERYADGHKSGRALDVSFRAALRLSLSRMAVRTCHKEESSNGDHYNVAGERATNITQTSHTAPHLVRAVRRPVLVLVLFVPRRIRVQELAPLPMELVPRLVQHEDALDRGDDDRHRADSRGEKLLSRCHRRRHCVGRAHNLRTDRSR